MTLTYLQAVNSVLSGIGAVQTSSLTSADVAVQRCKGYVNEAFEQILSEYDWKWNFGSVSLGPTAEPDVFSVAGMNDIQSLLIKYDDGSTFTYEPVDDTVALLYSPVQFTEEAIWATGVVYAAGAVAGYANNIYTTTAGGTAGVTPPTHTSGSVSDGGVTWTFTRTFTIPGVPTVWSKITDSLVRIRPYPGPLMLQRLTVSGYKSVVRLSTDSDSYPNMPIEWEGLVTNLATGIAALKHLDDPQTANNFMKTYRDRLGILQTKARRGMRASVANHGIRL